MLLQIPGTAMRDIPKVSFYYMYNLHVHVQLKLATCKKKSKLAKKKVKDVLYI